MNTDVTSLPYFATERICGYRAVESSQLTALVSVGRIWSYIGVESSQLTALVSIGRIWSYVAVESSQLTALVSIGRVVGDQQGNRAITFASDRPSLPT